MDHFQYDDDGELHCEGVALSAIADAVGTPTYVYSDATLRRHFEVFCRSLEPVPHLVCYSVKANTNQAVLATLFAQGSGADVVSGGELFRVQRAGLRADRVVFSGVGKEEGEVEAALRAGILMFNVESEAELLTLDRVAGRLQLQAPIALRVNPDVDPRTHPYIATGLRESKFGIPIDQAWELYQRALSLSNVVVRGIDCHIGSQLTQLEPVIAAIRSVLGLARRLRAASDHPRNQLEYLDVGGGLGIPYEDEAPPSPAEYGRALQRVIDEVEGRPLTVICEPGRVISGNAGVLLCRVLLIKENGDRRFTVVDAAMNDLIRPALYRSFHEIVPVRAGAVGVEPRKTDVVGPICESGDFFAKDRPLAEVCAGDLLAVRTTGAYAYSMASNYNSRPRGAEVLVRGESYAVVRARETYEDLVRGETLPPWLVGGGAH